MTSTVLLVIVCLGLGALAVRGRARPRRRAFVEINPAWRRLLRDCGLVEAHHFLDLPAIIVSGHLDRHVARLYLGQGPGAVAAYIKREHRVPWTERLRSALVGFGLASRSLREMQVLQALAREGFGAPEWLAAGEDGRGRAFLLIRALDGAVELRTFLREQHEPERRLALACRLGTVLARLHDAGFEHHDLYAKHVLTDARGEAVYMLDWQRARRGRGLGWRSRGRVLAALHATLDRGLASPRERVAFLRAYLDGAQQHPEEAEIPGQPPAPAAPRRSARLALVLQGLRRRTRRLLARRHVREKRQRPGPAQAWVCVDGEALCITPRMQQLYPSGVPPWLPLQSQPPPADGPASRRWLDLPGGHQALLVRRQVRGPQAPRPSWARGGTAVSAEQRQAALLLRLERHGVAVPAVLALGQRQAEGRAESFLLTQPPAGAVGLESWLSSGAATLAGRRDVLRQAGAVLARLHEASCYFGGEFIPLAVAPDGGGLRVMLDSAEGVTPARQRLRRRERRDLRLAQARLLAAGCGRTDLARFRAGYRQGARVSTEFRPKADVPRPPMAGVSPGASDGPSPGGRAVARAPETLWRRLVRGVRRLRQRADWALFAGADWPDRIMRVPVTDHFHAKQGRSTGRWVTPPGPGGSLTVYLKRHYHLPWWKGLLATLWPRGGWSPALGEWRHLQWTRRQGVPVPLVVAAAEYIGPWGRLQSFLAVEELTGMVPLDEAVPLAASRQDPGAFRRWKRELAAEMARLARMLHDRRVFHKDFYLCHFYVCREDVDAVPEQGWHGRVWIIDLHRLAHHPWTWRLWRLKDLAQLLYSSDIPAIDVRDRLWFWRMYRGTGPRRGVGRWLRRGVWVKWQRYRHHNARKAAQERKSSPGNRVGEEDPRKNPQGRTGARPMLTDSP
jgi:heptose I phosphotransferase